MTVNEFLKKMREVFPNMEFRATDKEGRTFKSKGWRDHETKENTARYTK